VLLSHLFVCGGDGERAGCYITTLGYQNTDRSGDLKTHEGVQFVILCSINFLVMCNNCWTEDLKRQAHVYNKG
jgi:hypothetical protein